MRVSILGLVLVLGIAVTAHADDKAKAKTLYEQGLKHYNVAEYDDAIKAWKEAYLIAKKPLLLFNIGQAYRLSGDCRQAMIFYDSYQREEANPKNQDELDQALALCKAAADKPKPLDKPVDKPKPPDKPIDKPIVKPVDKSTPPVAPIDTQPRPPIATHESEEREPEEPTPTTTGGGLRKIGIAVGVLGVVLGGTGVFFALQSQSASNELDGYEGEWGQEQIDLEKKGQRDATLGWVLGGTGIAAAAAGTVMFVIGGPKAVEAGVTIAPTRSGLQVGWSCHF